MIVSNSLVEEEGEEWLECRKAIDAKKDDSYHQTTPSKSVLKAVPQVEALSAVGTESIFSKSVSVEYLHKRLRISC